MPRPSTLLLALAACAALALSGCAGAPIAPGAKGAAVATLAPDGSVSLKVRKAGLFARSEVVVFHPGDPGYDAVRGQVESVSTGARKPVLTWSVGEPTWTN
jgi:hypothetical protein